MNILKSCSDEFIIEKLCYAISSRDDRQVQFLSEVLSLEQLQSMTKVKDVFEFAKNEALYLPKPSSQKMFTFSGVQFRPSSIIQYFVKTITKAFDIDLDTPPENRWDAQLQLQAFGAMLVAGGWIFETLFSFFGTITKVIAAASGIFLSVFAVTHVYQRYFAKPEAICKDRITNLNRKAEEKGLKTAIGRQKEMQQLIASLTRISLAKPKIAFLVGPPGVGKTQLVESLAVKMNEKRIPELDGKTLFAVNTASLVEMGGFDSSGYKSRLDLIFKAIEGHEKNVILFFDEAHNAATSEESHGRGFLIEQLKTRLLERNISAILATTEEEFNEFISPNKAFVERMEIIEMKSLGDRETALVLQEEVQNEKIPLAKDVIETVLEIGNHHDLFKNRANPRKSFDIIQRAIQWVIAWRPIRLSKELEEKEIELATAKANCALLAHSQEIPLVLIDRIGKLETEVKDLKSAVKTQNAAFDGIFYLRELESTYFKNHCQMVHRLSEKNTEELEKKYLFSKLLLSCVRKEIKEKVSEFAKKYHEEIPLEVTSDLMLSLYSKSIPLTSTISA